MSGYHFSTDWFSSHEKTWNAVFKDRIVGKILEIGSFEGRSSVYMIETFAARAPIELHCVDPWVFSEASRKDIESRFDRNIDLAMTSSSYPITFHKHKGTALEVLPRLLVEEEHKNSFDLVYVDGGHTARIVLHTAVLCFELLKQGGLMIFDDYLWKNPNRMKHPFDCPKTAVDAFVNVHLDKVSLLNLPLYQIFLEKNSR